MPYGQPTVSAVDVVCRVNMGTPLDFATASGHPEWLVVQLPLGSWARAYSYYAKESWNVRFRRSSLHAQAHSVNPRFCASQYLMPHGMRLYCMEVHRSSLAGELNIEC